MKRALLSLLTIVPIVAAVGVQPAVAADPAADGLWEQIDESTGKAEGWFRITQKDGVYEGGERIPHSSAAGRFAHHHLGGA